ncbi:MAG: hypothetical protein ACTSU5_11370 [Promethearchaeota archaeon]
MIQAFCISILFVRVFGGAFGTNLGASFWIRDLGEKGPRGDAEGLRAL